MARYSDPWRLVSDLFIVLFVLVLVAAVAGVVMLVRGDR